MSNNHKHSESKASTKVPIAEKVIPKVESEKVVAKEVKSNDSIEINISDNTAKLLIPASIVLGCIIIAISIIFAVNSSKGTTTTTTKPTTTTPTASVTTYTKSDKPTLLLFTMSFCPYGNQAEDFVFPVKNLLKDTVNVEPHYVIYSNYAKNMTASYAQACAGGQTAYCNKAASWNEYCSSEDERYCSMHGVQELNQNVRELCTFKAQPDKYFDYVDAINKACTAQNVDSCWEAVAKSNGVDVDGVKKCVAEQSNTILAEEVTIGEKYNVQGSPTIFLNDTEYDGSRDPEVLKQSICSAYNSKPGSCDTVLAGTGTAAPTGGCN